LICTPKEKSLMVRHVLTVKLGEPEPNFDSVYAHTLIEYGVERNEKPILNFFRDENIRNAFKKSFITGNPSILENEAGYILNWDKLAPELRPEFARFSLIFNEMVDRTCTPAEVRRDGMLKRILKEIKKDDIKSLRELRRVRHESFLADRLTAWFEALGYSIGNYRQLDAKCHVWVLRIPARRTMETIFVRSVERQAELEDVHAVMDCIEKHKADEGWLVSAFRKSKVASETAETLDNVFIYTFDELLEDQADFSQFFRWLETYNDRWRINTDYVPLSCKRVIFDPDNKETIREERYAEAEGWIEGYIDQWLEDSCKDHISILGEFGTGKTWFTHHYAFRLLKKYREAKEKNRPRPRIPILIHLRDFSKALKIESLFSDFFFRMHEIPLPGYSAFEELNRMGKLLLIFDGFDEMAEKLDRQKMINNFWELARVIVPGAKVILTCRTEHFPTARDGRALLNSELKASTEKLSGNPPQFEILDLEKFDEKQIVTVLTKRADKKTIEQITGNPELLDLSTRPVMLEFIIDALPEVTAEKSLNMAKIYYYAITAKLKRDVKSSRTFTSIADKFFFMCELSWEMLFSEKMSLNYREFPNRLRHLFGSVVAEEKDLDHWHFDMMGNSLLIRNEDGDYTPAHRSLLEFFVAYQSVAQLGLLPDEYTGAVCIQSHIDNNRQPANYIWHNYFRRESDQEGNVCLISPLCRFVADQPHKVLEVLGHTGDAVLRFIHDIVSNDDACESFHQMLAIALNLFIDGTYDTEKKQPMLMLIYRIRKLSQHWEKAREDSYTIRNFWKTQHQKDVAVQKDQAKLHVEILKSRISGHEPIRIEMIRVPAGNFLMGDQSETPIHRETINKPFYIGRVPVTQRLYSKVIGENPSIHKGDENPVENVLWIYSIEFCNALSRLSGLAPAYSIGSSDVIWNRDAEGFRLPTEVEWEYACRAGTTDDFSIDNLGSGAWYILNSCDKTEPVGSKTSNAWGIYDMHGNVWEFVWNYFDETSGRSIESHQLPEYYGYHVIRGGGWDSRATLCRSANFSRVHVSGRNNNLGFRLARSCHTVF
jgi:formylglycine-generating enzyme required for sulfatase activity